MVEKCINMLLGITIGDAFGAGYEMQRHSKIAQEFNFHSYRKQPIESSHEPGQYTDDTQMSIAVAELLCSREEFNHLALANHFVRCFKRDQRRGYAKRFYEFLDIVNSGHEFIQGMHPNSNRNGAAMRAVPLGIVPQIEDVINYAKINGELTHNTPSGIASSVCVAAASHYFFYKLGRPTGVFDFCIEACETIDSVSATHFKKISKMRAEDKELLFGEKHINFGIPCNGMRTAGAMLYLISNFHKNPNEALRRAILLGGDTDSVASITLGIVASQEGLSSLPSFLLDRLENRTYGRDYIISLGEKLAELI